MTEPIEEGDKVKAEIVHILYKDQIKYIQEEGMWYVLLINNDIHVVFQFVSHRKDQLLKASVHCNIGLTQSTGALPNCTTTTIVR